MYSSSGVFADYDDLMVTYADDRIDEPYTFPFLKAFLTISNFALLYFLINLMLEQYQSNYSLKSWSSIFHILCVCWLTIRGFFWVFTLVLYDPAWEIYLKILYWAPCPFEYGSFLLLPLFFAQVVYPREWRITAPYILPIFALFVLTMTLSTIVWIYYTLNSYTLVSGTPCSQMAGHKKSPICERLGFSSNLFRWFTALCFLVLGALQAVYSVHLYQLDARQYLRFLITDKDWITSLNIILFLSFMSRGVYQVLAIFDLCELPEIPLLYNRLVVQSHCFLLLIENVIINSSFGTFII